MQVEDVTFNEQQVEASPELLKKAEKFLKIYAQIDKLNEDMKKIKEELEEMFPKEGVKSLAFEEYEKQVLCKDTPQMIWNEQEIFKLVAPTPYAETVFPKTVDKTLLTDEDVKNAGLWDKVITRKFDGKAMEDLLSKKVFDLEAFVKQALLKIEDKKQIARMALKKK